MNKEISRLKRYIESLAGNYTTLGDEFTSFKFDDDTWSIKEIFGHLVDSAANNYQRFIRLQETDGLQFPGYDYEWIRIVAYNSYPFPQILELWRQYNLLICHIIENCNELCFDNRWLSDNGELTLKFLIVDYIDHMELHIDQLEQRINQLKDHFR